MYGTGSLLARISIIIKSEQNRCWTWLDDGLGLQILNTVPLHGRYEYGGTVAVLLLLRVTQGEFK